MSRNCLAEKSEIMLLGLLFSLHVNSNRYFVKGQCLLFPQKHGGKPLLVLFLQGSVLFPTLMKMKDFPKWLCIC